MHNVSGSADECPSPVDPLARKSPIIDTVRPGSQVPKSDPAPGTRPKPPATPPNSPDRRIGPAGPAKDPSVSDYYPVPVAMAQALGAM